MLLLNKEPLIFTEPPLMEHTGGEGWTILHGDTLSLLRSFQPSSFDALITDRPYASGGSSPVKRRAPPTRSTAAWTKTPPFPILTETRKINGAGPAGWPSGSVTHGKSASLEHPSACLSTGGSILPSLTPSSGLGGSGGAARCGQADRRPQKGRFRQQSEYIIWAPTAPSPSTDR